MVGDRQTSDGEAREVKGEIMGAVFKKTATKRMLAAAYLRISGRQQDKSPAEQGAEITKLATREGCQIAFRVG
jgi:hypothetical protein